MLDAHGDFIYRLEEDRPLLVLDALITAPSPSLPSSIFRKLATLFIYHLLSADSSSKPRARAFLLSIRQRHPRTFENAVQIVVEDDEALKEDAERLIVELSVVSSRPSVSD